MKALIIIDMFVRDVKNRKDKNKLISNQLKLIQAFKEANQKVIIVGGKKSGKYETPKNPVMIKLWGNEEFKKPKENKVIPELLNSDYDYYFVKTEYSAFFKTNLEKICKINKINKLYFAGISSGICIYFSAADAVMRGIFSILITDASGAPNIKTHKLNTQRFKDAIGDVLTTKQVIARLK